METNSLQDKRKDLYKKTGPKWKDQYKKRCHERLKKSREKFLEKFRQSTSGSEEGSVVKSLMVEEWRVMCSEHKQLPTLSHSDTDFEFDLRTDENIDEVLYVFEEIRLELLKEEQEILREYEAGCYYDEQAIMSAIHSEESSPLICPVCQKNPLFLNKGIIFCKCGVRIDTERAAGHVLQQDCLSLEHVRSNLEEASHVHAGMCDAAPDFCVMDQLGGVVNLMMTCKSCDYMHIIV